jgi:ABC-2 type transport system ATP-binding protein
MPQVLECQSLSKSYGAAPALRDVTLVIPDGRIVGLIGPNGSGKTTLIKLIAGLLTPTHGSVKVYGSTPGTYSKSLVSYLPDRDYLPNWMKVSDALDYFGSFYADFHREMAMDMLARLQVPLNAFFKQLSKGTREKVQLSLAMSRQSALYLLDEPIAGVDPATRDYILRTIVSAYDRRASIIVSTHLIADVEPILDDYILLSDGMVTAYDSVASVKQKGASSLDAYFREAFFVR